MPTPVAERVRTHRKRNRNGMRYVRVMLHETEIDTLVRQGYLRQERRQLPGAVEDAFNSFICHRLGTPATDET